MGSIRGVCARETGPYTHALSRDLLKSVLELKEVNIGGWSCYTCLTSPVEGQKAEQNLHGYSLTD